MRNRTHTMQSPATHRMILLAGLAGAMAEVVWIGLYCAVMPLRGGDVLRAIAATILPASTDAGWAPPFGLLAHFALGVFIAYAFAATIWNRFERLRGADATLLISVAVLSAIWAANFFLVLPSWNAGFVALIPHGVTFESKLLFGIAMATVFNLGEGPATNPAERDLADSGSTAGVALHESWSRARHR